MVLGPLRQDFIKVFRYCCCFLLFSLGMGTNTKMIFEYSFCDIRIYSNICFYTYLKLSYLSFLTLLSGYGTIRNIVLFIIVAASTFEHLPRAISVIRISEPKNDAKIRNIYISYNISQP